MNNMYQSNNAVVRYCEWFWIIVSSQLLQT